MVSPARPTGGRIKGAPLRALFQEWSTLRGRPELSDAIEALPSEHRAVFDTDQATFGVLPSTWYSSITGGHLLDELFRQVSPTQRKALIRNIARGVMDRTLRGVHRAVFRIVGSPELMRRRGQLFWNQQFDSGRVSIEILGKGEQLHVYEDWDGHHPVMCQFSFQCAAVMFEYMGVAPPIRVELRECAADDSERCSAIVRW